MEEALCEAKDRAFAMQEEVRVAEVLSSQVAVKVVKAFKAGEEYHSEVLETSRDAFL